MLHSGKGLVKGVGIPAVAPKFLFIALIDRGVVDVFEVGTGKKVATINVGGQPVILAGYWRQ